MATVTEKARLDGEFSDLTNGQIVQVTLILPKAPMKVINKDDIQLEENKLHATRVAGRGTWFCPSCQPAAQAATSSPSRPSRSRRQSSV